MRLLLLALLISGILLTQRTVEPPLASGVTLNRSIEESSLTAVSRLRTPEISAAAALVKFLDKSYPLVEIGADKRWPTASLTKLMTALIAVENLTVGPKVRELLRSLLANSSNEAAEELARLVGEKEFVDRMQIRAHELMMLQTSFIDPSGLSFLNQSTPRDLERLVDYIYKNQPRLWEYSRSRGSNHQFVGDPNFLGGKTGLTDEAGGNLISLFNWRGRPLLIIVMGAANNTEDRFTETQKLYDYVINSGN